MTNWLLDLPLWAVIVLIALPPAVAIVTLVRRWASSRVSEALEETQAPLSIRSVLEAFGVEADVLWSHDDERVY